MMKTDASTEIVREITFNAPAGKVFAALTEPEQLVQWWGDESTYHVEKMERDLRVGGGWRTTVVRFDLDEVDGTTHVRVTHSGFVDPEAKASHDRGWVTVLGWLRSFVE